MDMCKKSGALISFSLFGAIQSYIAYNKHEYWICLLKISFVVIPSSFALFFRKLKIYKIQEIKMYTQIKTLKVNLKSIFET